MSEQYCYRSTDCCELWTDASPRHELIGQVTADVFDIGYPVVFNTSVLHLSDIVPLEETTTNNLLKRHTAANMIYFQFLMFLKNKDKGLK